MIFSTHLLNIQPPCENQIVCCKEVLIRHTMTAPVAVLCVLLQNEATSEGHYGAICRHVCPAEMPFILINRPSLRRRLHNNNHWESELYLRHSQVERANIWP
ncbi:hypothetical protein CEXT_15211 [Caerostris extrusa]|uniref:Uncharacterized protein n=1 Tax=Caerostris extrusa TaxID=172846 RepID=A0AAV4WX71_CAEEX|nr:hypothetical protein CEXT_15211 [Caerostris extrusa]